MKKQDCERFLRGSVRIALWLFLLLVSWGFGVSIPAKAADDKVTGELWVQNAITMPKKSVTLRARLFSRGMLGRTGLGGEVLQFSLGGVKVGTALTGGDGWAYLEATTRMRGNLLIRVQLVQSPRVQNVQATGTLFSWEHRRPILFIELPALAKQGKQSSGTPFSRPSFMTGWASLDPLPDAAKELERLTTYYFNAVFLQQGMSDDQESTRKWLKDHEFPPGYVLYVGEGKAPLVKALEEFQGRGWNNIKAGIGRTLEFARTFAERRMKIVILSESGEKDTYPRKTKWAKDWKEVRRHVQ